MRFCVKTGTFRGVGIRFGVGEGRVVSRIENSLESSFSFYYMLSVSFIFNV